MIHPSSFTEALLIRGAASTSSRRARRLKHLQRQDLPVLSSLTTLFVLTLSAQMADGQIAPGGGGEVRVSEVERAVEGMPYCDVELEAEPALTPPDDY